MAARSLVFQIHRSGKDRQWYGRLVAGNGEPVCVSEGYKAKASAITWARNFQRWVTKAKLEVIE